MVERPKGQKTACGLFSSVLQGSWYETNPNNALLREIPQDYHRFALFDPPKIGNLMTTVLSDLNSPVNISNSTVTSSPSVGWWTINDWTPHHSNKCLQIPESNETTALNCKEITRNVFQFKVCFISGRQPIFQVNLSAGLVLKDAFS